MVVKRLMIEAVEVKPGAADQGDVGWWQAPSMQQSPRSSHQGQRLSTLHCPKVPSVKGVQCRYRSEIGVVSESTNRDASLCVDARDRRREDTGSCHQ